MRRTMLLAAAGTLLLAALPAARAEDQWQVLFNGQDLTGWTTFLDPGAQGVTPADVWSVVDGVIVCRGKPAGYLLSEKEFENYVLHLEWRWSPTTKRGGNSGVFVHTVGDNKIWPKAVEAQMMADHAGDFWLVDGAKLRIDNTRKDPGSERHWYRTKDQVERPAGEWNQYEIICQGDTIRLLVNGQEVNYGDQSELTKGRILLQSEGTEVHFRNIRVKSL